MKKIFIAICLTVTSCGKNKNTTEQPIDSLKVAKDSLIAQNNLSNPVEIKDPNVYEIPSDYPWLIKFIDKPFPWDTLGSCSRVINFKNLLSATSVSAEQVENDRITLFEKGNSFVKVSELHFEEMQDCGDNICHVVLASNWLPLAFGLRIGMSKLKFLQTFDMDESLKQNIFRYSYSSAGSFPLVVFFEFKDDLLSTFSYEFTPCRPFELRVPSEPFFTKFFNKPFAANRPDSVQKMIATNVQLRVVRDNAYTLVDKITESDMDVEILFDSSSLTIQKWPRWEIIGANLKSSNFSFINGIRVGMTRSDFLHAMGEKEFTGNEFNKCVDGFLKVNFNEGVITSIKYSSLVCQ